MITKIAASLLMQVLVSTVHYAELSHSMISSVTWSVHKWMHVPHLDITVDESQSDFETHLEVFEAFGSFGGRGDGFDYNNTATIECNTVDYPLYDPNYYDEDCE